MYSRGIRINAEQPTQEFLAEAQERLANEELISKDQWEICRRAYGHNKKISEKLQTVKKELERMDFVTLTQDLLPLCRQYRTLQEQFKQSEEPATLMNALKSLYQEISNLPGNDKQRGYFNRLKEKVFDFMVNKADGLEALAIGAVLHGLDLKQVSPQGRDRDVLLAAYDKLRNAYSRVLTLKRNWQRVIGANKLEILNNVTEAFKEATDLYKEKINEDLRKNIKNILDLEDAVEKLRDPKSGITPADVFEIVQKFQQPEIENTFDQDAIVDRAIQSIRSCIEGQFSSPNYENLFAKAYKDITNDASLNSNSPFKIRSNLHWIIKTFQKAYAVDPGITDKRLKALVNSYLDQLDRKSKELLRGQPILTYQTIGTLDIILKEGNATEHRRLKSMFETNKSGGNDEPDRRKGIDKLHFGYPDYLFKRLRPIYGTTGALRAKFNSGPSITLEAGHTDLSIYTGSAGVVFRLKLENVVDRATILMGDSYLNAVDLPNNTVYGRPVPYNKPDRYCFIARDGQPDPLSVDKVEGFYPYPEVAIHGQVRLKDIKDVIFMEDKKYYMLHGVNIDDIEFELKKHGISCRSIKENSIVFSPYTTFRISRKDFNDLFNQWTNKSSASVRALIDNFKKDPSLKELYLGDAGVTEGYTIEDHTKMVMDNFENFYTNTDWQSPLLTKNGFRLMLALHDIGKKVAFEETGDSTIQHEYTGLVVPNILKMLNVSEREADIIVLSLPTTILENSCSRSVVLRMRKRLQ